MNLIEVINNIKCVNLHIEKNPNAANYETIEHWVTWANDVSCYDISPEKAAELKASGEIWTAHVYPDSPIGFHTFVEPSLEKLIEALQAEFK